MFNVLYKTFHTDLLCGRIVRDGWFPKLVLFTGFCGFYRIRLFSVCDNFVDSYLCVRLIDSILKRYFFFFFCLREVTPVFAILNYISSFC